MSKRTMKSGEERVFIGGWVTAAQKKKLYAVATLRGETVNGLLRALIDEALPETVTIGTMPETNGADCDQLDC